MDNEKPFGQFIDAGTRAILANLEGNADERDKQIERGRAAYRQMRHETERKIIDDFDKAVDQRRRAAKKERPSRPLTQSLGDLLKAAGVTTEG